MEVYKGQGVRQEKRGDEVEMMGAREWVCTRGEGDRRGGKGDMSVLVRMGQEEWMGDKGGRTGHGEGTMVCKDGTAKGERMGTRGV